MRKEAGLIRVHEFTMKQHVVEIVSRDKSFSARASMDLAAEEVGKILVEEKRGR